MKKLDTKFEARIGALVREARLANGMSQTALGQRIGDVTFQQVQKYENGVNRVAFSRMLRIAEATGRPLSFFVPKE